MSHSAARDPWDLTPSEATALQRELRGRVSQVDGFDPAAVRVVAGVDVAYVRVGAENTACAVATALGFPSLQPLETRRVAKPVHFPYVPGLLAFREVPALQAAFGLLEARPEVVLVDAHGYAHPRRMGAASHLGLVLNLPTIGCAKSRLVGRHAEPGPTVGDRVDLVDRGEVIGAVVRTRPGVKPLYVSVGHRVSLETAVRFVLACCTGRSQMPEPTRLADAETKRFAATKKARIAEERA